MGNYLTSEIVTHADEQLKIYTDMLKKYALTIPTYASPNIPQHTPIYTPNEKSIQTGEKGRLRVRVERRFSTECSCGDCTSEPEEKRIAATVWNIDTSLDLAKEAADFYLLYDLSLDGQDNGLFAEKVTFLCQQFSAYTDMALGGELRHLAGKVAPGCMIPARLQQALLGKFQFSRGNAWT